MARRIVHLDMDAFYASVEQEDRPELKGRPVIVGGAKRGVVSAASYEARKFGVRSAMPVFEARRLCPHGIFLPVRMRRYKEVSERVMAILAGFSPLIERVSIDEAFIDITGTETLYGPPDGLARLMKGAIRRETGLTCSIGISPNKFLAKIASDMEKPDGLVVIEEGDVASFLSRLPIERIPGIGAKTSLALKELGVLVASDVLRFPLSFWTKRFGKYGVRLYEKAQGIDDSPVVPFVEPKSCGAEDTFPKDTDDPEEIKKWLLAQAESVGRELRRDGYRAHTVTLKIKFSDFRTVTRSRTLHEPTRCTKVIFDTVVQLLDELKIGAGVRLCGVAASNLSKGVQQTRLFADPVTERHEKLDRAIDDIRSKFGESALRRGRVFAFQTSEDPDG